MRLHGACGRRTRLLAQILIIVSLPFFFSRCDRLSPLDPVPVRIIRVEWPDTLTVGDTFQIRLEVLTTAGDTVIGPRPTITLSRDDVVKLIASEESVLTGVAIGRGTVAMTANVSGMGLEPSSRIDTLLVMQEWTAVTAGANFTCALAHDRRAYCWGANNGSQFGNSGNQNSPIPMLAAGGLQLTSISAGESHVCGLSETGQAFCWGWNAYGELGIGTLAFGGSPAPVTGGLLFTEIRAGLSHTCGVTKSGETYCWGSGYSGAIGGEAPTDECSSAAYPPQKCRLAPAPAGLSSAIQLAVGGAHTCAIIVDQRVFCWGSNDYGQSGDGALHSGVAVGADRNLRFSRIASRGLTTCGIATSRDVYCWGSNELGLLGTTLFIGFCGRTPCSPTPRLIPGGFHYSAVAVGNFAACGLTEVQTIACWGDEFTGSLGISGRNCPNSICTTPQEIPFHKRFKAVTVGALHSCAISEEGAIYCWGFNFSGQIGDGTTINRTQPIRVVDPI